VDSVREAYNTMAYSAPQVERIARIAFELALRRRRRVSSADQANVLESHRLWRDTVTAFAAAYPQVELEHLYIDNCAHELGRRPYRFDVILTDGLFGGIISDQAAAVAGSIGMLPSVSLGDAPPGVFEPVHGSAPRHTGQDRANPVAAIRSLALLLDLALGLRREAEWIEEAIVRVIGRGIRTYDIAAGATTVVGTEAMGDAIAAELEAILLELKDKAVDHKP
ncbi:MAG TPA: isocitrate/isopropylmalate family dehydrogenase, partial [Bacillota bacterium]